jgi:hypothetical protein
VVDRASTGEGCLQLVPAADRGRWAPPGPGPRRARPAPPHTGGLPDGLRSGIESLSGIALDGVTVHYNSPRPAGLGALAFAQGRNIHVAPGQERHLPHEAWHVVQQVQGRVRPTAQLMSGVPVNDDGGLEREADAMAAQALARAARPRDAAEAADRPGGASAQAAARPHGNRLTAPIQRKVGFEFEDGSWECYESTSWVTSLGYEPKDAKPGQKPDTGQPGGINVFAKPPGEHINETVKPFGVKAPAKKTVLHRGSHFELESDGPYKRGVMDIEFVTKPFDETKQGMKELDVALDEIAEIMDRLGAYAGRNSSAGQFVQPEEHRLSTPLVYLAGGAKKAQFKMQATQGVALESIPLLQRAFGTVPGETEEEASRFEYARVMTAHLPDFIKEIMGTSPALAQVAVSSLLNSKLNLKSVDVLPLKGFLSYMILYIRMLGKAPLEGIKIALPLMSRYSFSELFEMLSPTLKAQLRSGDGSKAFIAALAEALSKEKIKLGDPLVPLESTAVGMFEKGHGTEAPQAYGRTIPAPRRRFYAAVQSLTTVQAWAEGVLGGKDYLTYQDASQLLAAQGQQDLDPSLKIFLRGHGSAKRVQRSGPADALLAVMENRGIQPFSPGVNLTMDQARKAALTYLQFIINVKQAAEKESEVATYPKFRFK